MLTRPDEAGTCKHGTRQLIVNLRYDLMFQ